MKVNVKNIAGELQTLSDEDCFYYNKTTGELEYFNSERENPNDFDIDEIDGDENFIALPSKWNINDYEIMENFINAQNDDDLRNQLFQSIKGKGAFRRFRQVVEQSNMLQKWYDFKEMEYEKIVSDWCDENGLGKE